jgi:hypothetical protein
LKEKQPELKEEQPAPLEAENPTRTPRKPQSPLAAFQARRFQDEGYSLGMRSFTEESFNRQWAVYEAELPEALSEELRIKERELTELECRVIAAGSLNPSTCLMLQAKMRQAERDRKGIEDELAGVRDNGPNQLLQRAKAQFVEGFARGQAEALRGRAVLAGEDWQ